MAERGDPHEREAAAQLLAAALKKYKLTIADLQQEEKRWFEFKYANEQEKQIICGSISKAGLDAYSRKVNGRLIKAVLIECSPKTYTEVRPMIEWHLKGYKSEVKRLADAYQVKHRLWSDEPSSEEKAKTSAQREREIEAAYRMAAVLTDNSYPTKRTLIGNP